MIIPIIIICSLQLQSRRQLGLILILLSCGLVTAACSIGRVASLKSQVESDPTYDWIDQTYWQVAEQYGGIIFASLPAIRQLSSHWKQTRSLKASRSKPSALSVDNNGTGQHFEAKDDFGNPRTPGPFSPGYKKAKDYIELVDDPTPGRDRLAPPGMVTSPREKKLPPLPEVQNDQGLR